MDKELTTFHMMGKFKLVILEKKVGHNIQEDAVNETAANLRQFIDTFRVDRPIKIVRHPIVKKSIKPDENAQKDDNVKII